MMLIEQIEASISLLFVFLSLPRSVCRSNENKMKWIKIAQHDFHERVYIKIKDKSQSLIQLT